MSLLQMSLSGAVLISAVIVIRAITINKLPKRTFLVLWEIVLLRLLIPFSIPSVYSVYSLFSPQKPAPVFNRLQTEHVSPTAYVFGEIMQTGHQIPADHITTISARSLIWCIGMILCAAFFIFSYFRCQSEFRISLPVNNDFITQWLKSHPLKRPVLVRQSDKILAPLTYGILHPVILLPQNTDWGNTEQLNYIFLHEYVHIRRCDTVVKLISTAALCIHWFNPLVWVMYLLFNRDMELACDENVIRRSGETARSAYALMLINMETKKSGIMPLCNNFSKNAIEERITSIMKSKKASLFTIFISIGLVVGMAITFTTSAADKTETITAIPNTDFTEEDFEKLLALQFDDYENMSISEYQEKVWTVTDTAEYRDLLERFSQNEVLYQMKDNNEIASFLFYTLDPLTAEKWQTRDFSGYTMTDRPAPAENAVFEFIITLTIQNADTLTVREYHTARSGMEDGLHEILQDKTDEQLQNEEFMLKAISTETDSLIKQWSTDKLQISVEYSYMPLTKPNAESENLQSTQTEQEIREYPNATKEDYQSLLTLKTPDYQAMSIADFNMALLEWANEDYERMERINCDIAYQSFAVPLSNDELSFISLSVNLSGIENAMYVRSNYTGKEEEDPSYDQYLPQKTENENYATSWCDLYYQFSYHITDKETLSVGERDRCISGMMNGIRQFWDETDIADILKMSKEDIVKKLKEIAEEYSNQNITITIREDHVSFECMVEYMDEQHIYPE